MATTAEALASAPDARYDTLLPRDLDMIGMWGSHSSVQEVLSLDPGCSGTVRADFALRRAAQRGCRLVAVDIYYQIVGGGLQGVGSRLVKRVVSVGKQITEQSIVTESTGFSSGVGIMYKATVRTPFLSRAISGNCEYYRLELTFSAAGSGLSLRLEAVDVIYHAL